MKAADAADAAEAARAAEAAKDGKPVRRLLIANRGEIARRIVRTARLMGIATVAVFAESDEGAPFIADADRAVPLPGRTATDTYLNIEALIDAAHRTGADAVHPGYGFLSERAAFAEAVMEAGLTWVGPPPEVIESMGDKIRAKEIMAGASVPVLPSWAPGHPDVEFPVLVKAAAGGGGKGMRVVTSARHLEEAVAAAQREAQAAFGDGTVFLEKLVAPARHIEIQILADDHGNVVHCFERECSIQRRHQKIIEECPSPAVDSELRERIGAAAVAAARAVGYRNAGTVEFAMGPDGDFFFLEVNTRLQVEHPVTEAVTGLDLVREQLRVASGLPLSVTQEQLRIEGHAVEARLYAEDPARGFLPATGTLVDWRPATEPPARWDSGVEAGSTVGIEFDPMMAKIIVHAPTRDEAAGRLALALRRSAIRGVTTNRDFLVAALTSPAYLAGDTTTDFLERAAIPASRPVPERERAVAAIGVALALRHRTRADARALRSFPAGWRNSVMPPDRLDLVHAGDAVAVEYRTRRDGSLDFRVDGTPWRVSRVAVEARTVSFEAEGVRNVVDVDVHGSSAWAQGPDGDVEFGITARHPAPSVAVTEGGLLAPMPGKVVSVAVGTGAKVAAGELLMIVEAMKMEHRVTAPHDGTVTEFRAAPGDQVNGGDVLVVLTPVGHETGEAR